MEVLPFKSIREEDAPIIGSDLYNLVKLSQLDFPVEQGVIVLPPQLKIKTLLEHYQYKDGEVFEQKLTLLQSQIKQIPVPGELETTLTQHKIDTKKLWVFLLEFWINELRQKIYREGFSPNLTADLSAQSIFFSGNIKSSGVVYFDQVLNLAVFNIDQGEITDSQKVELEELIKKANKKLLLPQIYSWVLEKQLKIVGVSAITNNPQKEVLEDIIPGEFKEDKVNNPNLKSTVKVFLQADELSKTDPELDGAILNSQIQKDHDAKILQLVEMGQNLAGKSVIFKLFDDKNDQLRGALQLIHRPNILAKDCEVVLFARNKKHLANIGVAIPFLRSPEELSRLKLELSSLGIARQGNMKLWIELAVPENFLNLEDYLDKGVDGVLINLDELSVRVGGFNPQAEEGIFYQKQVKAVLKLLEPAMKILHKEHIPAIVTGSLAIHDDVLDFLIERGIYGISVDSANFLSIHERLRLIERRVVKSR